jgi:C1A family cysteine protease
MDYNSWNPANGIASLAEYPYTDYRGSTTTRCGVEGKDVAVVVSSGKIVITYESQASLEKRIQTMKQQLAIQPVSIVIKSTCLIFSNYKRGILTDDGDCACGNSRCVDHAVLLVGYNDDVDIPYWTIKK